MKSKTYNEVLGIVLVIVCIIMMISFILLALEMNVNPLYGMLSALVITIALIFVLPSKWFIIDGKVRK